MELSTEALTKTICYICSRNTSDKGIKKQIPLIKKWFKANCESVKIADNKIWLTTKPIINRPAYDEDSEDTKSYEVSYSVIIKKPCVEGCDNNGCSSIIPVGNYNHKNSMLSDECEDPDSFPCGWWCFGDEYTPWSEYMNKGDFLGMLIALYNFWSFHD